HSPKLKDTDDSWFFMRHGKRVKDRSRYQLDYRNPAVRAHATEVIRRLVEDYGVGYIKMDYNINAGIGTEAGADSVGDGLLQHNRAYLEWLDGIFARYPDLVIENCSSGGMRMDYAMLSRHSIQSTSDQEDYVNYAAIAAASPSALTPEQSAIWSYPLREGDDEEVVFNMV
ncbi:alpha-galactosidase, partial [Clostridium perfringens]